MRDWRLGGIAAVVGLLVGCIELDVQVVLAPNASGVLTMDASVTRSAVEALDRMGGPTARSLAEVRQTLQEVVTPEMKRELRQRGVKATVHPHRGKDALGATYTFAFEQPSGLGGAATGEQLVLRDLGGGRYLLRMGQPEGLREPEATLRESAESVFSSIIMAPERADESGATLPDMGAVFGPMGQTRASMKVSVPGTIESVLPAGGEVLEREVRWVFVNHDPTASALQGFGGGFAVTFVADPGVTFPEGVFAP